MIVARARDRRGRFDQIGEIPSPGTARSNGCHVPRGDTSPFIRRLAVESLNFQINALVYTVVLVLLIFVIVGIPLLVACGIRYLVRVIRATRAASRGQ